MSNEKFESDIPKIILEKEDREAFQRTRQQSNRPVSKDTKDIPEGKKSSGSPIFTFFVFLLAVGAGGACYWLYEQKLIQDQQLERAEQRIQELERRLSATGEEMDQSAVALQVKVTELSERSDELWSQMDKLWASAWRRNQSDIKELTGKVSRQERTFTQKLSGLEGDITSGSTNLAVIQEQVNSQQEMTQDFSILLSELERQDSGFKRQFGDIQAKLIATDQVNSALNRRIADLEKWREQEKNRPAKEPVVVTGPAPQNPPPSQGAGQGTNQG